MNEMRWSRPVGRTLTMNLGGQLGAWVVIWVVASIIFWKEFAHNIWTDPFFMWPLVAVIIIAAIALPLSRKRWAGVWYSTSIIVKEPSHLVVPRLERTLADGNVSFESIRPAAPRSRLEFVWDEVYQLDSGGLRLHITAGWGKTRIHVGPVGKDNRAEVERAKWLVEKALG